MKKKDIAIYNIERDEDAQNFVHKVKYIGKVISIKKYPIIEENKDNEVDNGWAREIKVVFYGIKDDDGNENRFTTFKKYRQIDCNSLEVGSLVEMTAIITIRSNYRVKTNAYIKPCKYDKNIFRLGENLDI